MNFSGNILDKVTGLIIGQSEDYLTLIRYMNATFGKSYTDQAWENKVPAILDVYAQLWTAKSIGTFDLNDLEGSYAISDAIQAKLPYSRQDIVNLLSSTQILASKGDVPSNILSNPAKRSNTPFGLDKIEGMLVTGAIIVGLLFARDIVKVFKK